MFCKYCGKQIDPSTMRCRMCGREAGPLSGGNGFWDLSKTPEGQSAPAASAAASAADTREVEELRGQVAALRKELEARPAPKKNWMPLAGGGLALLAALVVALVLLLRPSAPEQQPLVIDPAASGAQEIPKPGDNNGPGGESIGTPGDDETEIVTPSPESQEPTIIRMYHDGRELFEKQPLDEEQPSGEFGKDRNIFTASLKEDVESEKYDIYWVQVKAPGNADAREFAKEHSLDELRYYPIDKKDGMHEFSTRGVYYLAISKMTDELAGYYALVLEEKQPDGNVKNCYISEIVRLSIENKEFVESAAPPQTPDPTPTPTPTEKPEETETFTVTFLDWNGTELSTQTVKKGGSATLPTSPTREGYTFTGWSSEGYRNVQSDLTITALYEEITTEE
jgi:uncharacterized repeat protein (TIGR02543 family)